MPMFYRPEPVNTLYYMAKGNEGSNQLFYTKEIILGYPNGPSVITRVITCGTER